MRYHSIVFAGLMMITAAFANAQGTYDDAVVGYAYTSPSGSLQFENLYHRSGGDITVDHTSEGQYKIRFYGASTQGSYIPMLAWPAADGGVCTISGFGPGLDFSHDPPTFRWVGVQCSDALTVNPDDDWNQVLLVDEGGPDGSNTSLAFVESREAMPPGGSVDLSSENSTYNPGGGTTSLSRTGLGEYYVSMDGLGAVMPADVNVYVAAFSDYSRSCRVADWTLHFAGSDNARVQVRCSGPSGPVDMRFVLLLTSTEPSSASAASAKINGFSQPSEWTTVSGSAVHNPHGQVQFRWDGDNHQIRFEWPSDQPEGVAFVTSAYSQLRFCSSTTAHRPPGGPADYLQVNVNCFDFDGTLGVGTFTVLLTQVTPAPPGDLIFSDRFAMGDSQ
ncbi:MAG: hypothetical protein GVY32_06860 [Gammaproteobacteria bacterium]|jgi:hypothetical protein|nr:hypothetical protein [Gammaproteobacteria bacterium]